VSKIGIGELRDLERMGGGQRAAGCSQESEFRE
jgi:hypothetical protein